MQLFSYRTTGLKRSAICQPSLKTVPRFGQGEALDSRPESQPAQATPVHTKKGKLGKLRAFGKSVLNCSVLMLAMLGGAELTNRIVGDGPLPKFSAYHGLTETELDVTKTADLDPSKLTPQEAWLALDSSVRILDRVVPEIADWLQKLQQENKIRFDLPALAYKGKYDDSFGGADSCQHFLTGTLHIGPDFWSLPEWEKAGFLVHEYRHSRQNSIKTTKICLLNACTGHRDEYSTGPIELEAYLYEWAFYEVLKKDSPEEVKLNLHRYAMDEDGIRFLPKAFVRRNFSED